MRAAVLQGHRATHGLIQAGSELSNGLTELRTKQLKSHRLGSSSRVADVALDGLGHLQRLLQLLQLLVEHADGFGPFGNLLDLVLDRDGIGDHRNRVLCVRQRRDEDETEKKKENGLHRIVGWRVYCSMRTVSVWGTVVTPLTVWAGTVTGMSVTFGCDVLDCFWRF